MKNTNSTNKIRKISCICLAIFMLVFIFLHSNIIHSSTINIVKGYYKLYQDVYANEENDTVFSFTDDGTAVLVVNSVPYWLVISNNTKKEFNFDALIIADLDEVNDETKTYKEIVETSIVFYDDGATVKGDFYGTTISIDVKKTENANMESGLWILFNKFRPDSTNERYMLFNGQGEDYYIFGEGGGYKLVSFSVSDKVYALMIDGFGWEYDFIRIEKVEREQFGFDALKIVSYIGNEDEYFRLVEDSEKLDFKGGSFNAKYITSKKYVEYVGQHKLADCAPFKWRLFKEKEYDNKSTNMNANMNLSADGMVNLQINQDGKKTNYTGKWYVTRTFIVVALNEKCVLGKIFGIEKQLEQRSYGQRAISKMYKEDVFRVGYRNFHYYFAYTYYTVYWGSDFSDAKNVLNYETEYALSGYYYKWYYDNSLPFSYETETIPQNDSIKLVFHEDNTVDTIRPNGTIQRRYEISEDEYRVILDKPISIKLYNGKWISVKEFYLIDGNLCVDNLSVKTEYGTIYNYFISFVNNKK